MKKRKDIAENYKWDLSEYCTSDEDFYEKCKKIESLIPKIEKFKGKLNNKKDILAYLKESKTLDQLGSDAGIYCNSRLNTDLSDRKANEMNEHLSFLGQKLSERTVFVDNEIYALSDELLDDIIADKAFKDYDKYFKDIKSFKKHILHPEVENFLSGVNFFGTFYSNMKKFTDVNLKFDDIKDSKGKAHKLDSSLYGLYLRDKDRELRKNCIIETHKKYGDNIDFLANNYVGYLKKDCYMARARKFDSALACALDEEDVTKQVYSSLIKAVRENLPILFKYFEIKKKKLGLKDFYNYDASAPMNKSPAKKYSYQEAISLIKNAVAPLGEEYVSLIQRAYDERWIDAMPNENKRSGAYEICGYLRHPLVLTNFNGTYDSVTTLAHELGHAMHSYFSNKNQPKPKTDIMIFVAEIASTTNEMLLIHHLLNNTTNKNERSALANIIFDDAKATIYRQTMFAEFEERAHALIEENKPVTKDTLNELYFDLNKTYFGKRVKLVKEIQYEWARIPHFFTSFYVYKYAVGLLCAMYFTNSILKGEEGAVERYLGFLSSGGKDTPINILKEAGCDVEDPKTFESSFEYLKSLLKEL